MLSRLLLLALTFRFSLAFRLHTQKHQTHSQDLLSTDVQKTNATSALEAAIEKDPNSCTTSGEPDALSSLPAPQKCIRYGGKCRCWYMYAPRSRNDLGSFFQKAPLIVDLHGAAMCATDQAAMSGWRQKAESESLVVLWPMGEISDGMPNWGAEGNAASADTKVKVDDVGFLRAAIATVVSENPDLVDPQRIYMAGYSTGCMLAQRFALEAPDIAAAVGCQSGYLLKPPATAPASFQPMPILTVHGNEDKVIPYSTDNSEAWVRLNRCGGWEVTKFDGYREHRYNRCDGQSEVVLIELEGVGHASYSPGGTSVDTTEVVWRFLINYRRADAAKALPDPYPTGCTSEDKDRSVSSRVGQSAPLFFMVVLTFLYSVSKEA